MGKDTGKSEEKYLAALAGKKIAAVTLDHKWHQLLSRVGKTHRITEKEKELNELLRRQGKCTTETQSIRKLKKKLMDEIVSLMEKEDAASLKKTEDNKRLINECNEKMEQAVAELENILRCLKIGGNEQNVNLDFSIVNDMDYYTGIIFQGFINGVPSDIQNGGRYDNLLHKMDRQCYESCLYFFLFLLFSETIG